MFDFDRVIDRRGTHASKWDLMAKLSGIAAADGIPMWVADMDFAAPPGVTEALTAAVSRGATSHEIKARAGLAPLVSAAKSAGVVFGEDFDAAPEAGGLVPNRVAGCPRWPVPGKGLQVN